MKRLLFLLIIFVFIGCTANRRAKTYGGTENINLPSGQQLVNMTWKESSLWILTKPADSAFVPQTYTFQEKSSFGIMEGTIIVIENK